MNEHEHRDERSNAGRYVEPVADVHDDEISLQPALRSIWLYRRIIGGVVTGVMTAFVIAALVAFVYTPVERMGRLGFRLLFDGASEGVYPNGTPFSTAEITSTAVLTEVFDANGLDRFGSYEDLQRSIFILQSNLEFDSLSYEYQTKLADSGLTSVDRARIEDEFEGKREGLIDPRFTLNLRQDERIVTMPPSLVSKVLDDTLATWARQAVERKGALLYDISVFSGNILRRDMIEGGELLTAVDILRTQVIRIIASIEEISTLPGAAVVRMGSDRLSLGESRAQLEDILRFQIWPLLGMLRVSWLSKDSGSADLYISNQLFQIRLEHDEARKRVQAVQEALSAYMRWQGTVAAPQLRSDPEETLLGLRPADQGMIPLLSESFLDRLVKMSTLNSDVGYQQEMTDRVIAESFVMAALEREQGVYEEIGSTLRDLGPSSGDVDREGELLGIKSRLEKAFDDVLAVVEETNAIYVELSARNLNPTTLLYTVITPFTIRTERTLQLSVVGLYGILVFMLSLFVVPLGCLGHSYFQREIVHCETEEQLAGRALGGQSEGQPEEEPAERTARA